MRMITWPTSTLVLRAIVILIPYVSNRFHEHVYVIFSDMLGYQSISTLSLTLPAISPEKISQLDAWLRSILWDRILPGSQFDPGVEKITDFEIHRLKGLLHLSDGSIKIAQGVREVFEITHSATRPA